MKVLLALTLLLTTAVLMIGADASSGAIYFGHEKMAEALSHDSSYGDLFTGTDLRILAQSRSTPGVVEVHETETDVFYMVDGTETMVTGGTVVGGKVTGPNQRGGGELQGGETRHLTKGDLIVIPAGTPHWIKDVTGTPRWINVKAITAGGGTPPPVIFLDHEKVSEALAKSRLAPGVRGNPPLFTMPDVWAFGSYRLEPGEVQVHETETEIVYVLEGAATMVTGGTVVGGKVISPGEIRGSAMQGGQTHRLSKGEVMLLPAGTPHWDQEITGKSTYFAFKIPKR